MSQTKVTCEGKVAAATVAILGEVCGRPGFAAALDARLDEIIDLDSLRIIEAVALLEEEFGVEVQTDGLEGLATIGDIVRLLQKATLRK